MYWPPLSSINSYATNYSTVKRLELDYTIKEVVYVKFNTGLGLYDGWYELGIFANSFNMPRQSFGKYSILGITIIGNDGSELQLDECRECTSH